MGALAEILELLHNAYERVDSFTGTFRVWSHADASSDVLVERPYGDDGPAVLHWQGAGPNPVETTSTMSVWLVSPDRLRVEIKHGRNLIRLRICDATNWWHWSRAEGARFGAHGEDRLGRRVFPLPPLLLDPAQLMTSMRFEPYGLGTRAGRDVRLVRATPRAAWRAAPSYELELDASYGTLLRSSASDHAGRPFHVVEAVEANFGSRIDANQFEFVSPDGKDARPPGVEQAPAPLTAKQAIPPSR